MLKNIILFSCICLFCGALIEAFLFLVPEYQAGEPLAENVFCEGHAPVQRPSALYGKIGVPNGLYFRRESEADGWYLRAYNEDGFRDLMNTGSENVVILGDSFIEGELVNNDQTIPYLLDAWNPDLAFREFALGGWGTADEYRAYRAVEEEIDHQLVVLGYFIGNDLSDNLHAFNRRREADQSQPAGDEASLLFDLHVQLRAYSRAYTFFYVNGRRAMLEFMGKASLEDSYMSPGDVEDGVAATNNWLSALSDAVAANGAELLIVTFPSWNELIGVEGEQRLSARQRDVIQKVAEAKNNVRILDLNGMVENAGYEKLYGKVDKHFNELGYYLTAKTIHEWINGTWRPTSATTPAMHQRSIAIWPDCAAASDYIDALSAPGHPIHIRGSSGGNSSPNPPTRSEG